MNNYSRLIPILLVLLFASIIWVGYYQFQTYQLLNRPSFSEFDVGLGLTSNPTPGNTGPYRVCTLDYDFSPDPEQWWMGRIYIPVLDNQQCRSIDNEETTYLNRKFNVVIIAHADGEGTPAEAHLNYEGLATHLASNAMIVISLNRYAAQTVAGASSLFDQVLTHQLDYLYNESAVRNVITENIAIIGHSAGGNSVLQHAGLIEELGYDLKSTVLLAPTVNLEQSISFANDSESFLGVQVTRDLDFNAYGAPVPDQVMGSGFRVYDELPLSSQACQEKDMLFVTYTGHYFQNEDFTQAYVNAYLQLHLNEHNIFNRFFKYQQRPPALADRPLWQQHDEWHKFVLDDFEQFPDFTTTAGGIIDFSGIGGQEVDWTYLNDTYSPHSTHALRFSTNNQGLATTTLNFFSPTDLSAYPFLGFRISQIFDPENNATGEETGFRLRLNTTEGPSGWVQIEENGGLLHFPPVTAAPLNPPGPATQENGGAKNAMRSYLIRSSAFTNIDLGQVESVTFDFGVSNNVRHFVLDDVAFYGF